MNAVVAPAKIALRSTVAPDSDGWSVPGESLTKKVSQRPGPTTGRARGNCVCGENPLHDVGVCKGEHLVDDGEAAFDIVDGRSAGRTNVDAVEVRERP